MDIENKQAMQQDIVANYLIVANRIYADSSLGLNSGDIEADFMVIEIAKMLQLEALKND